MKKLSPRRKKFLRRYEQWPKNYKFIFNPHIFVKGRGVPYTINNNRNSRKKLYCPANFSIIENGKEIIKLLNRIKTFVYDKQYVSVDFRDVSSIDIDALMALLATVRDLHHKFKDVIQHRVTFAPPDDKTIKQFVENSGFFRFALGTGLTFRDSDRHFEIHLSDNFTKDEVMKICNFTCDGGSTAQRLYPLIMELCNNVRTHAYGKKNSNIPHGYIFCKKTKGQASFVLMDTGRTIPGTVAKRRGKEAFNDVFNFQDSDLIASALRGEDRSETQLENRNKGLKQLISPTSPLKNLKIISRKGRYSDEKPIPDDYTFDGTMFRFNILIGGLK